MRSLVLMLLLVNFAALSSGQDSLRSGYAFYYPDGKQYTGKAANFDQLNNEVEEKGRVWVFTIGNDRGAPGSAVAFRLFTAVPLWVYTAAGTPQARDLIGSVAPGEFDDLDNIEAGLKKFIERGTLTDLFILETLGPPDNLSKYVEKKNYRVTQWTYARLQLVLIFTNRKVTNYFRREDHR